MLCISLTLFLTFQMNQQHFPGGGMVPPFLPPGSVPPHAARALMAYPMPGVVVPPASTTTATPTTREEPKPDDRVSPHTSCVWLVMFTVSLQF